MNTRFIVPTRMLMQEQWDASENSNLVVLRFEFNTMFHAYARFQTNCIWIAKQSHFCIEKLCNWVLMTCLRGIYSAKFMFCVIVNSWIFTLVYHWIYVSIVMLFFVRYSVPSDCLLSCIEFFGEEKTLTSSSFTRRLSSFKQKCMITGQCKASPYSS